MCLTLSAQSILQQYTSNNCPLPTNEISCLLWDDAEQLLWVGTEEGLLRYVVQDNSWTLFTSNNSGLPDNRIRALAIDSQQKLWIGTLSGGLASFDGQIWRVFDISNSDLPDNFVQSIDIAADGSMWLGSTGGATQLTPNGTFTTYYISTPAVTLNNVTDILLQNNGTIWFSTINAGLVEWSNDNFSSHTAGNSPLTDNTNLAMCSTDNGNTLWLASPFAGWNSFVPPNTWQSYNTLNSDIPSNFFQTIVANNAGQLLGGSTDAGLVIYTPTDHQWAVLNSSNSALYDDHVRAIALQNDSIVWVGTNGGLALCRIDLPTAIAHIPLAQTSMSIVCPSHAQECCVRENSGKATLNLSLYNMVGQKIVSKNLIPPYCFPTDGLPKGWYIGQIVDEKGMVYRQKIGVNF